MNTYTNDNRWAAGASGADVGEAIAHYSARWIDYRTYADIVGDRSGFAYNDMVDAGALAAILNSSGACSINPSTLPKDETIVRPLDGRASIAYRRAGGYIYVDAWLAPA